MWITISKSLSRLAFVPTVVAFLWLPQPAQARGNVPFFSEVMQAAGVVITSASRCFVFVYDKNGNRVSQTISTPLNGAVLWATVSYGCFAWSH